MVPGPSGGGSGDADVPSMAECSTGTYSGTVNSGFLLTTVHCSFWWSLWTALIWDQREEFRGQFDYSKIVAGFGHICSNQVSSTSCGASLKSNQEVFDDPPNIQATIAPMGIFCHAGYY